MHRAWPSALHFKRSGAAQQRARRKILLLFASLLNANDNNIVPTCTLHIIAAARYIPYTANVRNQHFFIYFERLRALEPRAGATSRKVLTPGKIFPLPSSTTNGHPIFRGPVRRASASVTRFFAMLYSSPSPEEGRAIIAGDLSPGGVRLSGAIRPSPDVVQKVRGPPGGEELGKNTRRALPIF